MANLPQHSARERFDARVRAELRSIPLPGDLRDRILSGRPRTNVLSPAFWKPTLAIAAGLALFATSVLLWNRDPSEDRSIAGFENRMASFAVRQYSMDVLTKDFSVVRQHLESRGAPSDLDLPEALRKTPLKGGAKLAWQGRPVAMVCFEGPSDKTLYLFVVDAGAFGSASPEPELERIKGLSAAAWTQAGNTYFLAADLPEERLKTYLNPP